MTPRRRRDLLLGLVASTAPLSAPPNLAAGVGQDGVGNTGTVLTWDTAAGVTWLIERKVAGDPDYSQIDTSATNGYTDLSFDTGGFDKTFYRVRATNGVQTSAPSNVAGAYLLTTPGIGTFAFPAAATVGLVTCLGHGGNGDIGGGGAGALAQTAISIPSGTYNTRLYNTNYDESYLTQFDDGVVTIASAQPGTGGGNGGAGGLASSSIGDIKHSGGNGGANGLVNGGSGGGAGGKTGNGGNGGNDGGAPGAAGTGGTLSGIGGQGAAGNGGAGASFGGGGAGAVGANTPGAGAGGCIAITWKQPS